MPPLPLVDERPEEVTDMQRSVKGEVIASTFDEPATCTSPMAGARPSMAIAGMACSAAIGLSSD
ncbi:MAG: hypothetical protein IPG98_17385 [Burkholderiales bacterium]|nr:hypothetical protein [Burkholderiales bacterium]MBK8666640.1 hypothetical protein [Burkholderiales bacterium]